MKVIRWINLVLILAFLSSCSSNPDGGSPIISIFASPTPLPTATFRKTPAPDAQAAVTAYLEALKTDDYNTMYAMLTRASRDTITQEDFAVRYRDALNNMSASTLDFTVLSSLLSPYTAEVAYHITYRTALVGDIDRDIVMRLSLEEGQWKVQWEDGLILPELAGGNVLRMDYDVPARGNIYDQNGLPVVGQSDALAFGIIPGQINPETEGTLVAELSRLCGISGDDIRDSYVSAGADWYIPMCEGTREEAARLLAINPGGLVVNAYNSRYYFDQGLAPQVVGYTLSISAEELDQYRRLGYRGDEKVGQAGIEKWAEDYLAGQHGGTLYVVNPATAQIVTRIGQSNPLPADSIYLTLDRNLQFYAQKALGGFKGAIVVLEMDTGRVLAMASSPDFDPNLFEPTNPNNAGLTTLLSDTNEPLVNRAAQGQYPLGSAFKVITFSAALESGLYLKETTYDCQYDFTELTDRILHDWTWQHCQDAIAAGQACDSRSELPSGVLTLQEGLMRSCNPYFWHIGLDLFKNWNRGSDIANMARAFGLGSPTGVDQVAESSGNISVPTNELEATNQAIGQGDVLVTPLQAATFIAAVGNGGTLYRPQIIEKIQPIEGDPITVFKPEARGTLPLRPENLKTLQDALWMVVHDPRGTAQFRLRGLQFPVAGKTGTAESGNGKPHAWFVGYTLASQDTRQPDIAIAVLIENVGEGSDYAAPIFQRMVETYYYGSPQTILWFEESLLGPTKTPTPFGGIPTKTKKP
jgi:penicillin-binding protein 2